MQQAPNRLRELREEAGLTLAALGSQVGVSKQAISDFEQGDKAPSLSVAALIARVLSDALARTETVDGVFLAGESTTAVDDREGVEGALSVSGGLSGASAGSTAPDGTDELGPAGNRIREMGGVS